VACRGEAEGRADEGYEVMAVTRHYIIFRKEKIDHPIAVTGSLFASMYALGFL
jgi:hypothetical protein